MMKETVLRMLQNNFIITEFTYAIQPVFGEKHQSVIFTEYGLFYSEKKPLTLIKDACEASFSTFEERRRMIAREFHYHFRTPIPISPEHGIYAFPTEAIHSPYCEWYFANNIVQILEIKRGSKVLFRNGSTVATSFPKKLLVNQLERTSRCMYSLYNYGKMMQMIDKK